MPYHAPRVGMQDNSDLRVKYLRNKITENAWVSALKRRQKEQEKNREVWNVLEVYTVSMTDIFNNFVAGHLDDIEKEAIELKQYCNREFSRIRSAYGTRIPLVDNSWMIKYR